MTIMVRWIEDIPVRYRPGTTDEKVLREVVDRRGYRRVTYGFDVEAGEHWLDLGANIGSFAVYCRLRGATAECYEPESECFKLLVKNAGGFRCVNAAVTAHEDKEVDLYRSRDLSNLYRYTIHKMHSTPLHCQARNVWAGYLANQRFDGVKMDIEGSELDIIDEGLIPACDKLCMEYHTSRDSSAANLQRRLDKLRGLFKEVRYPAEYDRMIASGQDKKTYFDRFIFCWGAKKNPGG